ncbi:hypothetical protein [Aureimonas phyllosphaerae]|uniref:Uncharacterized protein n=1 Tax=Aureimonas phyllosphaerae TaxID=1166078 RepID=A0A7W6BYV0_9HYPH|nr:hypothetical protein [Aureimonas phyllosphaerae]MBB3937678.1 hypothetical protein [Aureimonas phyllosphaerae]MBB3961787.1 hypothetical protein [Aureimonas phyllosphaerae]
MVIDEPALIATPADMPGAHAANDPLMTLMIAAAQAHIDGPPGWLGRCLGVQTLEWSGCDWPWPVVLPYPPLIEVLSVHFINPAGVEQTLPVADLTELVDLPDVRGRMGDVRIRYRAGYEEPPASAKAAVILMAMGLASTTEANGGLRAFTVDGAFSRQFNSPEVVARVRTQAVENLLQPLRVYA